MKNSSDHSAPSTPGNLEEMRDLLDNVRDLIHSVDREGRFLFVNRTWIQTLGYSANDAARLTVFDLITPDEHENVRGYLTQLFATQKPTLMITTFRTKDGRELVLEGNSNLRYVDGVPVSTRTVLRDITDRRRAEERIHRQLLAIQFASEGIAWVDATGNYLHLNPAQLAIFGFETETQLIGRSWESLYAKDDIEDFKAIVSVALEKAGHWTGHVTGKRRDGSNFPLHVSISASPDGGFISIVRDLTTEEATQQQIIQNLTREKQLNELQTHFVSMASHEMRTPLATLSLGVEFLVKYWPKLDDTQIHHSLQTVHAGVQQMRAVLDDILVVGRSEEGRLVCKPAMLELVAFCRKITTEVESRDLDRHEITWICATETLEANVDAQLLRHILINLLSNACKFSPEKSPITLELKSTSDELTFLVTDRGIGIPEAEQARLFGLFFRASNATKVSGSGLGLSVVRRCVETHGGTVAFDSAVGRGTRFTVTLPL